MPVKVRCECGAGISAPDAARGKVIKCRKCGQPVRVPKGPASGGKSPRRKKASRPRPSIDDENFFSALDLEAGVDQDVRICPKCAAEVDEEDIECPECGVNLETGMLSARQKKKRKRKGPDPDDYLKVVWKNSMDFLKKNKTLAIRLSLTFSVYLTVFLATLYMAAVYCMPEDPTNPETPVKVPVILFWGFLSTLSGAASMGCFWQLFVLINKATMEGRDSLDRFNFDFFVGVALGIKLLFWPVALLWPLFWAALVLFIAFTEGVLTALQGEEGSLMAAASVLAASVVFLAVSGVLYLIPVWTLPVALSHMSAKFTYRAYIPYHMFKYGFRAIKGVCVWWLVAFTSMLPALLILVPAGIYAGKIYDGLGSLIVKLVGLCGIETELEQRGFMFDLTAGVFGLLTISLAVFLVSLLLAFAAVFLMRATGLFTFYNQKELGLGEKRKDNVPADFWVRYLAYTIDVFLINVFVGIKSLLVAGMIATVLYLEMDGMVTPLRSVDGFTNLLIVLMYYVFSEGTAMRGTLGKTAIGLVVTDEEGNSPITKGQAFSRFVLRGVSGLILGIGFLMCAWDPEKRTLHDKVSKTRVMWAKVVT